MKIDSRTADLIQQIYGCLPDVLTEGIAALESVRTAASQNDLWSERDIVLITYADQVHAPGQTPLQAQRSFLLDHGLDRLIRCVHLLPFCPYTSDDGFSVVDYLAVDPQAGTWDDITVLGSSFDLMFDLVLNHASQQHDWFQQYLSGNPDFSDFFLL